MPYLLKTNTVPGTAEWEWYTETLAALAVAITASDSFIPTANLSFGLNPASGPLTLDIANPSFYGQELQFYTYGANAATVVFASAINAAGNTTWTTSGNDQSLFVKAFFKFGNPGNGIAWRLISRDGGALS